MTHNCAACGGPWTDNGYQHTPTCRIGRATTHARRMADTREAVENSSLGTPGAKALRKHGWLLLGNLSDDPADAALTPDERQAIDNEIEDVTARLIHRRYPPMTDERTPDEVRLFELVEAHLSDTEPPFDPEAGLADLRRRTAAAEVADAMEHQLGPVTDEETTELREQWPPEDQP